MFDRNAQQSRGPTLHSTPRIDIDDIVGLACLLMLPIALLLV